MNQEGSRPGRLPYPRNGNSACVRGTRSGVDGADLHFGVFLAVADLAVVAFAAAVLDGVDLGALDGAEDLGGHGGAGDDGRAELGLAFAGDQQHLVEGDGLVALGDGAVDAYSVAGGDFELGAAVFNDRVHRAWLLES